MKCYNEGSKDCCNGTWGMRVIWAWRNQGRHLRARKKIVEQNDMHCSPGKEEVREGVSAPVQKSGGDGESLQHMINCCAEGEGGAAWGGGHRSKYFKCKYNEVRFVLVWSFWLLCRSGLEVKLKTGRALWIVLFVRIIQTNSTQTFWLHEPAKKKKKINLIKFWGST